MKPAGWAEGPDRALAFALGPACDLGVTSLLRSVELRERLVHLAVDARAELLLAVCFVTPSAWPTSVQMD
jgi:hypothetical protein